MRHPHLTSMSAVMALLLPGIALAAGESKEAAQRAKFLAEHPAVAKIIPASEANIIPPRMLVQTEALKTPVYNPDGGVLPEIWTNIIASKAWTGRYTGYGIYNFAPQTPITLENIAKGESDFMKGNGGGQCCSLKEFQGRKSDHGFCALYKI